MQTRESADLQPEGFLGSSGDRHYGLAKFSSSDARTSRRQLRELK